MNIKSVLKQEDIQLQKLNELVELAVKEERLLSHSLVELEKDNEISFGSKLADVVASFGGSWTFIIGFFLVLLGWVAVNAIPFILKPFDPYPFIFLNLVLSCLAAIQAPIIMMSQNRREKIDRKRS